MLRVNDAAKFWRWFEEKSDDFRFFREMEPEECEELFESLTERLHLYCTSLFFEMRINAINEGEFIVTAEGVVEFFDDAEFLVSKAPEIDHWTFTALIPADEDNEGIEYEDLDLIPSEMWFTAIEDADMPDKLNLVIHFMDYDLVKMNEHLDTAIFLLLQSVLGEKMFAQHINVYTTSELPGDPDEGFPVLDRLPEYIAEMKKEGKKNMDDYR